MIQGGSGGRIINIASLAGILTPQDMDFKAVGYLMAKWGAVALTRSFATSKPSVEKAEGIKAYALCPYYADTELVRTAFDINDLQKRVNQRVMEWRAFYT